MHAGTWKDTHTGAVSSSICFESDVPYTAKMLTEDLLEAGVRVLQVDYEEDADVGMKYHGGELSPDLFLSQYDTLRRIGMGGMDYCIHCVYGDESFMVGMADNSEGRSYNRIVFSNASPKLAYEIAESLRKI